MPQDCSEEYYEFLLYNKNLQSRGLMTTHNMTILIIKIENRPQCLEAMETTQAGQELIDKKWLEFEKI